EAGRLLAKVNPVLPKPLPPGVPDFVFEVFQADVEANRAVYRALCGENAEELKSTIKALINKQPNNEKLQEVARAFNVEIPATIVDQERLRALARPPSPPLLL